MPVLNELGISFSNNIWLNSLVSMGTMMGLAALKCSDERPYSSADFPLFSLSIAGPTSASEIVNSVTLCIQFSLFMNRRSRERIGKNRADFVLKITGNTGYYPMR